LTTHPLYQAGHDMGGAGINRFLTHRIHLGIVMVWWLAVMTTK
jgi:hypothetical protein